MRMEIEMAKMKVYELAQEMGLQSKDILTALKNKGIEVKSHMSVLEDGQVEDLKNSLKAPAKSEETPKAAEADKKEQPADAKAPAKKKKPSDRPSTQNLIIWYHQMQLR